MPYRVNQNESIQDGVIRIAREQIGRGIGEIEDSELGRHEGVHQVRKRCKKVRALLRLVRPALAGRTYDRENARFRDAARSLSHVRDAQSMVETVQELIGRYEDKLVDGFGRDMLDVMICRRGEIANDTIGLDERLSRVLVTLRKAYARAGDWKLTATGIDAVADGLRRTYRRGRTSMKAAYDKPTADRFHDWRKRAKYHSYHLRLLRPVWHAVVKNEQKAADSLGDLLGDDHNLAVLRNTLKATPTDFGDRRQVEILLALADHRRLELEQRARPLGERLFTETPDALVGRFTGYWRAWEAERRASSCLNAAGSPTSARRSAGSSARRPRR